MAGIPQVISSDSASGAQVVDGSLKFDHGSSQYLKRTPGSSGNRKTWTWSGWVKITDIDKFKQTMFGASSSGTQYSEFRFMGNDTSTGSRAYKINFQHYDGSSGNSLFTDVYSEKLIRDIGWYHFVCAVDFTRATAADRVKLYVNGELTNQVASGGGSATIGSQNLDTFVNNSGSENNIGTNPSYQADQYFDGLMSQVYLIDGQALGPGYFGFTDSLTGTWRPKKFKDSGTTINDGTTWSGYGDGNAASSYEWTHAFDGSFGANDYVTGTATYTTITFPKPIQGENIHLHLGTGTTAGLRINGAQITNVVGAYNNSAKYKVGTNGEGDYLESISLYNSGSQWSILYAIEVDGILMRDGITQNIDFGTNGFYLPMEGNTPVGEDKSGQGNDWTPVNHGGSVALDSPAVSGARPILNTTQGGTQAGVGVFGSKENKYYTVTTANGAVYQFDITSGDNPSLEFIRGATYKFDYSSHTGHPLLFSTSNPDSGASPYTDGTSIASNVMSFTVPHNAPNTLYYYCSAHPTGMNGEISVTTDETKADPYAWKCTLALPFVGSEDDVSHQINCTTTEKSMVINGDAIFDSRASNFYHQSFLFGGSGGDGVYTADNTDFEFESGDFTVECWVKQDDTSGFDVFVGKYGGSSDGEFIVGKNGNTPTFYWQDAAGNANINANLFTPNTNDWYHMACVRASNVFIMYINGVCQTTSTDNVTLRTTSNKLTIGIENDLSSSAFAGHLSDIRIYKGVAKYTGTTVGTQYFVPPKTFPDILPDTPSGTSVKSKLTKITDGAVRFDGTDDYLDVSDDDDFDFDGDFTVEFYVYFDTVNSRNDTIGSGNNSSYLGANKSGWIASYYTMSGNKWHFSYQSNQSWIFEYTFSFVSAARRWYHVAFTRSGSNIRCFVDGVQQGSTQTSSATLTSSEGLVRVGGGGGSTNLLLNGCLSNVRIVKGTALYTSNFTPPTEPLTNVTNTKLLCCQSPTLAGEAAVVPGASGINDGTSWSEFVTITEGITGTNYNDDAINAFDGDTSTSTSLYSGNMVSPYSPTTAVFTPPTPITVSSGLRVNIIVDRGQKIYVNDVQTNASVSAGWNDTSFTGTLTSLRVGPADLGSSSNIAAIEIDGVNLKNLLLPYGAAKATNFNPFNTDINTVRGQEDGYATLNPIVNKGRQDQLTYSGGNLRVTSAATSGSDTTAMSTLAIKGKIYCEFYLVSSGLGAYVGVMKSDTPLTTSGLDTTNNDSCWVVRGDNGNRANGESANGIGGYGSAFTTGDLIMMCVDIDNSSIWWGKNGIWFDSGNPGRNRSAGYTNLPTTEDLVVICGDNYSSLTPSIEVNFGQKPFKFPPPDGFQPLNAANVRPETVITRPDKFVGTILYTGNNSARSITGYNFSPDFVITKQRTNTGFFAWFDVLRGPTNALRSHSSDGTYNDSGLLTSFDSNGFSIGTAGDINSSNTYVAWSWKAGGNSNTFNVDDEGFGSASDVNMAVGNLNSTVYNTGQIFSSNLSASNGFKSGMEATKAFNGDPYNRAGNDLSSGGGTLTLTMNITVTEKIRVLTGLSNSVTIDGVVIGSAGFDPEWIESKGAKNINEIVITAINTNGYRADLFAIEVDGKILCDSNQTPPNAPSKAPTSVSVNTKSKFGIYNFYGDFGPVTLAHGLGQKPDFMICKKYSASGNSWVVWHKDMPINQYTLLNSNSAAANDSSLFNKHTNDSDHLWSLGQNTTFNENGQQSIAYLWCDVPGLQKFGMYFGNNDSDGPYVDLGFRPAILWVKRFEGGNGDWIVKDSSRYDANRDDPGNTLVINVSDGEDNYYTSGQVALDLLSNGFKIRHSGGPLNDASGSKYLYCAWAEAPSVNLYGGQSNAR